jgi:signal transduction histidine kinase
MRIKTFLATYVLFLLVLFSIIGIVSVYLTNSQMSMLKDKSTRDFQTIAASLSKDIQVLQGRSRDMAVLSESVETLIRGYARYYRQYNIEVFITEQDNYYHMDAELSVLRQEQEHFIRIAGTLSLPMQSYRLDYAFNITDSITEMRNIQRVLLLFSVIFSLIAAFGLYFILLRVFKPLNIVAGTSRKIANGNYGERIHVKSQNELSSMALDFNRMAEQIENQIKALEDEAANKQQFIDNFAHEMRTPLTSIYGYAEYLLKSPYSESETIESLQNITEKANHLKQIANSLLELATLRNYTPVKTNISIGSLFSDIEQTLKEPLQERNVELICKNDIDILEGQEDLVKSLLLNLCSNAIKACPQSGGVVHLEATTQDESIVLSVTDNGCGIAATDIEKITEPFYRVDEARSREHGGAGLGLTLCKQIAEVHGAEMVIESAVREGTIIKVTFTNP